MSMVTDGVMAGMQLLHEWQRRDPACRRVEIRYDGSRRGMRLGAWSVRLHSSRNRLGSLRSNNSSFYYRGASLDEAAVGAVESYDSGPRELRQ